MTTTDITTEPVTLDVILDHAATVLNAGAYANAPLPQQVQFALGDAFRNSGYTGDALTDVKLLLSDLLWQEAGERNLTSYCNTTHDRRKVVRLLRRTARKLRS